MVNIVVFIIVVLIVMALLLYAVSLIPLPPSPPYHAADNRRLGGAADPEPRNRVLHRMVRAALALLLLSVSSGCTSVVIIQRSVPTVVDQWRPGTTVTVPKDNRQPITVRER